MFTSMFYNTSPCEAEQIALFFIPVAKQKNANKFSKTNKEGKKPLKNKQLITLQHDQRKVTFLLQSPLSCLDEVIAIIPYNQLDRIWTHSVQLNRQIKSLPSCNQLSCIDNEISSVTCENVYDYSLKKVFCVIQGCFMKMEYVQSFIKSHKKTLNLSPVQSNFNKIEVFSTSIAFVKTLVIRLRN